MAIEVEEQTVDFSTFLAQRPDLVLKFSESLFGFLSILGPGCDVQPLAL